MKYRWLCIIVFDRKSTFNLLLMYIEVGMANENS